MTTAADLMVTSRLVELMRQLGIRKAHFAARVAIDFTGFAATYPDYIASLALICPPGLDPSALREIGSRLMLVNGDNGPNAQGVQRSLSGLPGATHLILCDYFDADWADVIADRADEVGAGLMEFLASQSQQSHVARAILPESEGEIAGITYRIRGSGPPLLLLPLALAPSQWEPLVPVLSQHYCTIILGGPYLGYMAVLEDRSRSPQYVGMFLSMVGELQPERGQTILDVGCGTGSLDRWLANRTGGKSHVVATDINRYLLSEATTLARVEGVEEFITFQEGNAEALPFLDNNFDASLSVTVMEEVDANRMLSEMVRVTRPGGKIAVIVRAQDRSWWINLPLHPELKTRIESSAGGGSAGQGCADASLYRRFIEAGLINVRKRPIMASFESSGPYTQTLQSQVLATLSPTEAEEWRLAVGKAKEEGTFFIARPYHCAIGTKSGKLRDGSI